MDNKTMVKLWNLILEKTKGYDNESGGNIIDFENGFSIDESDIEKWYNDFYSYDEKIDQLKEQYENCEYSELEKALKDFYEKEKLIKYLDFRGDFFDGVYDYVIAKAKEVEETESVIKVDKGFCNGWNNQFDGWEEHISYEVPTIYENMSEAREVYKDTVDNLKENEYVSIEVEYEGTVDVVCTEYGRNDQ